MSTPGNLNRFKLAVELSRRLAARATELSRSDYELDRHDAHQLIAEVDARSTALIWEMEAANPALVDLAKALGWRCKA